MAKKGTQNSQSLTILRNLISWFSFYVVKSRTISVRLISMALTGYYKTLIRPRVHRPLSMLKYDPVGMFDHLIHLLIKLERAIGSRVGGIEVFGFLLGVRKTKTTCRYAHSVDVIREELYSDYFLQCGRRCCFSSKSVVVDNSMSSFDYLKSIWGSSEEVQL